MKILFRPMQFVLRYSILHKGLSLNCARRCSSNIKDARKKGVEKTDDYYTLLKSIMYSSRNGADGEPSKVSRNKDSDTLSKDAENKLDKDGVKRLLQIVRLEVKTLSYAMGTLAITSGISLVFPAAIGHVLDISFAPSASISHEALSVGLFGLFMLQSSLIVVRSALLNIAGERLSAGIRRDLFKSILQQDIAWFDSQKSGDVVNRLSADTSLLQRALTFNLSNGLRSVFMVFGGVGMVITIDPILAVMSLCMGPPLAFFGMKYGRYVQGRQKAVQAALGDTMEIAQEVISSMRTVRSFAREKEEAMRFDAQIDESFIRAREIGIVSAGFDGAVHMASNFSFLAVLLYGGHQVSVGAVTPGDLTAFLMYSLYIGFNISNLSSVYTELKKATGAASRIYEVIDRPVAMPLSRDSPTDFWKDKNGVSPGASDASRTGGVLVNWHDENSTCRKSFLKDLKRPDSIKGDIEFSSVSFSYPTRKDVQILRDFSLKIAAGTNMSIVGMSGSGKSTIGSLLTRMYDPFNLDASHSSGVVSVDGVDIKELDPQWLRQNISLVAQEAGLFGMSIADNIRYGCPGATEEKIKEAAVRANAHDFICSFPDGYDTIVGERGVQLSGGQRQRVAIARALLKDAPIVVLDEATSALDSESENLVTESLASLKGKTVITIAHRLSTIRKSDSVVVLGGGRVIEQGNFEQLYHDENSHFRKLIDKQLVQQ
jgi:ABC-type multidrug transport system fused ATPase/permease subunit